jgi:hypothetical protein
MIVTGKLGYLLCSNPNLADTGANPQRRLHPLCGAACCGGRRSIGTATVSRFERLGDDVPDEHGKHDEQEEGSEHVRPFPKVDEGRSQVSQGGGTRPLWSRNGRELFYLDGDGFLTAVPVQVTSTTFSPGKPIRLVDRRYNAGSTPRGLNLRGYDAAKDGQRFLMIKDAEASQPSTSTPASIIVVLNWFEELKRRVP